MPQKPIAEKKTEVEVIPQKNKMPIVALLLCFLASVAVSSGVTYFLLQSQEDIETITKLGAHEEQLSKIQETLTQQDMKMKAIEAQNETLKLYLRHSSATALKNILINQEQNIQAYLKVMKSAMSDLSALSPRTTDWNDEYQYQLDLALKGSIKREDLLKLLKTGEPNDKAPQ
ncbi:hypothetical protein [Marinomonas shanghaiensis]|uniref:hypothetical protein n=1 Tax=Marinomonas shanghaiensis TaxID=2202418 RepID=UPI000DB99650|nr:hypothetical protein [Marinomonas shanghaiensis]